MASYSAFEHLRRALFLRGDSLMSMLTVYMDETGHKENGKGLWTWCFRAPLFTLFKIVQYCSHGSTSTQVRDSNVLSLFLVSLSATNGYLALNPAFTLRLSLFAYSGNFAVSSATLRFTLLRTVSAAKTHQRRGSQRLSHRFVLAQRRVNSGLRHGGSDGLRDPELEFIVSGTS